MFTYRPKIVWTTTPVLCNLILLQFYLNLIYLRTFNKNLMVPLEISVSSETYPF